MKERDLQIDGLKYFLICLVVIMHCAQGGRYNDLFSTSLYSVIYTFHIPLFVLLSGYFFHCKTIGEINNSNLRILEPLLVFHLFSIRSLNPIQWITFEPCPLWYLLSLMFWRYMAYYTGIISERLVGEGNKRYKFIIQLSVAVLVYLLSFVLIKHGTLFSIMRTCQFFPFFMVGVCLSKNTLEHIRRDKTLKVFLVLATLICIFILVLYSGPKLCAINFSKYNLFSLSEILERSYVSTLVLKILVNLMALLICFGFLALFRAPKWFCLYGKSTLFILCCHVPFYYISAQFCSNFYVGILIGLIVTISLTVVSLSKKSKEILYPISFIIKQLKYETKK